VGTRIVRDRGHAAGLADTSVRRFLEWTLLAGFLGAHLFDRFVYFPGETAKDPLSLLRFWQGLSSFGGFLGGATGALLFLRKHAHPGTRWAHVDAFAYAFPFPWVLGRLGCFLAYDHPGLPTTFPLSEVYRDGVLRHNLGLDEALYTLLIALLFALLGRRPRPTGFYLGLFMVLYGPFRFTVDFLRIVDARYLGLTPAQYGSIALVVAGAALLALARSATRTRGGGCKPAERTSSR
jgi:phosphatidylglycerol---prolipoprotein diacylglyceryl transferase